MMKVSDYIAQFLAKQKIDTIFGVTGGAAVHFFDSAEKFGIQCVFTHHEQTSGFSAGAYARLKGLGAAFFTTGPGGTNTITGIAAAWLDSLPVIYIGGQVRSTHIKSSSLRQQGAQELDIINMVKPIVKYATCLKNASDICFELEKCLNIATSGRPGPVYLEIPLDLQWALVEPNSLTHFTQTEPSLNTEKDFQQVLNRFAIAQKPLLLIGHGVRLAKAEESLKLLLSKYSIPYITTWNALDLAIEKDPLYLGCPGMFGTREANLAIQSCDFLCCIGTHLPIPVTTGLFNHFAMKAEIAVINIDQNELDHQRVSVKYPVLANAKSFIDVAIKKNLSMKTISNWRKICTHYKKEFAKTFHPSYGTIDAYDAVLKINELSKEGDTFVVDGGGTIVQIAFQTLQCKNHQRVIIDAGLCAMGSGLPQLIGAAFAKKSQQCICLCGDGSFQFNVQELQTIFHHKLPVKIFIFNNSGYLSIRNTQEGFLNKHYLGSSVSGGISVPNIIEVAKAYQIPSIQILKAETLEQEMKKVFSSKGPMICEIMISPIQEISPKIGFDEVAKGTYKPRSMEDMWPYLEKHYLQQLLNQ